MSYINIFKYYAFTQLKYIHICIYIYMENMEKYLQKYKILC